MAEREGFEPSVSVSQYTGLANRVMLSPNPCRNARWPHKTMESDEREGAQIAQSDPVSNGSKVAHAGPVGNLWRRKRRIVRAPGRPNPHRDSLDRLKARAARRGVPHTHLFKVYFIREPLAGSIKVGIAFDPEIRITNIQAHHPPPLSF